VRHPLETLYACSDFPTRTGIREARSGSVKFKVEWWLIVGSGVDRSCYRALAFGGWWLVHNAVLTSTFEQQRSREFGRLHVFCKAQVLA
jgi:hypothetical protein